MRVLNTLSLIFLLKYTQFPISRATNSKLLEIEPYLLSDVMKQFMIRIILENSNEKDGFLFIAINKVEPEFSDFAIKKLNQIASVIIINFGINWDIKPLLNPNHFKFVLTDPEGDLSHANDIFKRVRVSRAKIVLIMTKKPIPIFIPYLLNSYRKIKCINVILVFESDGKIQVITYNPYLPTVDKTVNLTNSPLPFFYDKTLNLLGSEIKGLFTYSDRTKIKRFKKNERVYFEGKDYNAIETIVSHLNGKLQVVTMDNVLFNPWFEAIDFDDRTEMKTKFLEKKDISILIKSEQFSVDDHIVENLYPHTQNDLSFLVPKTSEIPLGELMLTVYTPLTWIIIVAISLVFVLIIVIIRKLFNSSTNILNIFFEIYSILIINQVTRFPRNFIERLFIFGWILCSFIINNFIQTKITSFMATGKHYPDINTIDQLFASGLPLYSLPNYAEEVEKKYFGTKYEKSAKALIPLASNEGLMDQMIYKSDVSEMPTFITEHDIAIFVSRCKDLRRNGAQTYHLVKESIIPNYQAYKVIHNSPLLPAFNKKLRRLGEGGFIELWAKRAIHNATIEGFLYPENFAETKAKALSLHATWVWFYILFVGYLLSIVVFLSEILVHKMTQRQKIPFLN